MDRLIAGGLGSCGLMAVLLFLATASSASAQSVNFRAGRVRATVPILSTNVTAITNRVWITNTVTPVNFSVAGLPTGVGYALTETNGTTPFLSAGNGLWDLLLTLYTTNVTEGVYDFTLNGTGGATEQLKLKLQAAHIWNGANGAVATTNNSLTADRLLWSQATNWLGGVPGPGSDIVFTDIGAQTNVYAGKPFTNIIVDASATIGSIRFSQSGYTNSLAPDTNTPPRYHGIQLNAGVTLTLTNTEAFSLLRDTIDDFYVIDAAANGNTYGTMGVEISGPATSALVVTNDAANFAVLVSAQTQPTLNVSNLATMKAYVNRFALSEYQAYPNYANYNDNNDYGRFPRRFVNHLYLAQTNIIRASFVPPGGYANENTRQYAFSYMDSETAGVGSSVNNFLFFGRTNQIFADGVCLVGANHAVGNGGAIRFGWTGGGALFRNSDGVSRMSIFSMGDDGGTTNRASSNVKATVDFNQLNGVVDMLVDEFYMSRDRAMIASNDNPTAESTLYFGKGIIDANKAFLGYQEHDSKTDWTTLYSAQVYRGYCRATMIVSNTGTFKVNGNLTLGYTSDTNPASSCEPWNTVGQLTVYSNSTVQASNIVVDGGMNFYDGGIHLRQNNITLNGGTLIITNSIGFPVSNAAMTSVNLPLDNLTLSAATIVMQNVDPSKTNIHVRNLLATVYPSTIKILNVTGVASYPAQLALISYQSAAPYLKADVSAIPGGPYAAYILDNSANQTIDVFIGTNTPKNLIWKGYVNANWNTVTKNWLDTVTGLATNFDQGDYVTFDDSVAVNAITVVGSVIPGQTGTGVLMNNTSRNYSFSGGTISGTSLLVKQGTGSLTINGGKSGPLDIQAGTLTGSGFFGAVTMASNTIASIAGTISGGLTSTGKVTLAVGGQIYGPVALRGGTFTNSGYISTAPGTMTIGTAAGDPVYVVNNALGTWDVAGGNWDMFVGSTLGNMGQINNLSGRLNFAGLLYGTGVVTDPDGGTIQNTVDGRLNMRSNRDAKFSPGAAPSGSIGTFTAPRVDLTEGNPGNNYGKFIIEINYSNPGQPNDRVAADRWNTIYSEWVMTNITGGSFSSGQEFLVFTNNNGPGYPNYIDAPGIYPLMWPTIPAPGLTWNLGNVREWGTVGVTNIPLIWDGVASADWEGSGAFKSGKTYSDNNGALFDDSASGGTSITLSSTVAPAWYSRTTNILVGSYTNYVTNSPMFSPGLVFSNSLAVPYTIGGTGKISGLTGLYKTGPGKLTMLTTNDYTGGVFIDGGTLEFVTPAAMGMDAPSGNPTWTAKGGFNQVNVNGATLHYFGTVTTNFSRTLTVEPNGGTLLVSNSTTMLMMNQVVRGAGALIKTGPGILDLSQNDTHTGGTVVNNGVLRLSAQGGPGWGPVTVNNGATLEFTNTFSFTNALSLPSGTVTITVRSNIIASGQWSGAASATISNAPGSFVAFTGSNSIAGFTGTLSLGASSGSYRLNNTTNNNACTGSATTAFDLGTGTAAVSNLNGGGVTYDLGSLAGGANTILAGRVTNSSIWTGSSIYSIGAKGGNTAFDGRIMNGNSDTVSIVKVGSGRLCLNGINTYTGSTTVSNGTLGGNGTIAGSLTVEPGATLEAGCSIGTLTVGGAVTLKGATLMELDRTVPAKNDKLVASTVSAPGTLTVNNIGPTLYNGSTFVLFTVPVSFGSAPSLPGGYAWANNLGTSGSITVTGGGLTNPVPPSVTSTYSGGAGGTLTMSWPYENLGWTMYSNSVSLSSKTDWYPINGSGATNQVIITSEPGKNVFYMLRLP